MSQEFEIVRHQPEAERKREAQHERFTRHAPCADASFEALEKASRKKPAKELELEDLPEELRGKAHLDGDVVRIYTDADKSKELFAVREDRLKSEKINRDTIRTMIAVAKHRHWDRIVVHGEERFRREAWREAMAHGTATIGYNPTEKDVQATKARWAFYQSQ